VKIEIFTTKKHKETRKRNGHGTRYRNREGEDQREKYLIREGRKGKL
jgi:hypothetical protein